MKTNILVEYKGGGYDGCFWEWNYFFIDKDGEFHDIFSSGRAGITNKQDGQEFIDSDPNDVYIYDLTDVKEIKTFNTECNVVNITGVLQWFEDNPQDGIEFFAVCSKCKNHINSCEDIHLEEWHGCGGIASTADVLICSDCYSIGVCGCCNEYVGESEIVYLDNEGKWNQGSDRFDNEYMNQAAIKMLNDGYDDVCNYCLDYQAGQIEQDEKQDLLFLSISTGTPDMFSDEMKWLWGA